MRKITIGVPGFEGRNLKIIDNSVFKSLQVYVDGQKVGMNKFKYTVVYNEDKKTEVKFLNYFLIDAVKVVVKNKESLYWYQYT